jgi:class 3 adenylate cyclase
MRPLPDGAFGPETAASRRFGSMPAGPPLPEHPELRAVAEALETAGISGEILDASWRLAFISSEEALIIGLEPSEVGRFYGKGLPRRQLEDGEYYATTEESSRDWWKLNVPMMRAYLEPDDEDFEAVFGALAKAAARVPPAEPLRAWASIHSFPDLEGLRTTWLGDTAFLDMRINDDAGTFIGVLRLAKADAPDSLMARMARGDQAMHERMDAVRTPARRTASILFADIEASGELSRRLSSRGYFELIRQLTDLIDSQVIRQGGIVGKHAGDGASALFLVEQLGHSESEAAAAAVRTARAIRDSAPQLGPDDIDVRVNVGVHWGATLTVGQVATGGRLEVTALGDEMNEAARIESAARNGTALASKLLLERLDPADASELGLDLDDMTYSTVGAIEGSSDKAVRDAGSISVTSI